jgi:hypothetical protein
VALVARFSRLLDRFGISWRVDQNTHRAIPLGIAVFWALLGVAGALLLIEALHRLRPRLP